MTKKSRTFTQQPQPFHPSYLVSMSSFASYCADNGLRVDQDKLEQLHKEGWFLPTLKIMRGVVEFRKIYADFNGTTEWRFVYPTDVHKFSPTKIAKEKYYTSGTIGLNEKWFKWHMDNNMVSYPSQKKYENWKYATGEPDFITDWRKIERYYELFYDKRQMFLLKHIMGRLTLIASIKDASFKRHFTRETKQDIKRFYAFLNFYIAVEALDSEYRENYKKDYDQRVEFNNGDYKPVLQDMKARDKSYYYPWLRTQAKNLLKKYEYTQDELDYWRRFLASKTLFGEARRSTKQIQAYLKGIREETLKKAEDVNLMIATVNQFIYWATGKEATLHNIQASIPSDDKVCVICHNTFHPLRDTQVTCGRAVCVSTHKNELKKRRRRHGRM